MRNEEKGKAAELRSRKRLVNVKSKRKQPEKDSLNVEPDRFEEIDVEFERLLTEQRNPETVDIDRKGILEILEVISSEDKKVPCAVEAEVRNIAQAVDLAVNSLKAGGRLLYVGAGTSGRLGAVDAAECPPTFGTSPDLVQAIIAGGRKAMWRSVEGAEDDSDAGKRAIIDKKVSSRDVVIGLSASGRTPFVLAALEEAKRRGARTVAISTTPESKMGKIADVAITPLVGPEVITGSTRMKAGTAEKLVLNMISTASMIRMGKVYSNLMIDLNPLSGKLRSRARRILMILARVDSKTAGEAFEWSGRDLKTALVMLEAKVSPQTAQRALKESSGIVWKAIETAKAHPRTRQQKA